jgi:hypothetical protein
MKDARSSPSDEMAQLRTGPKSLLDFMLLVRYNVAQ